MRKVSVLDKSMAQAQAQLVRNREEYVECLKARKFQLQLCFDKARDYLVDLKSYLL
jgi:hypothetical protein